MHISKIPKKFDWDDILNVSNQYLLEKVND